MRLKKRLALLSSLLLLDFLLRIKVQAERLKNHKTNQAAIKSGAMFFFNLSI